MAIFEIIGGIVMLIVCVAISLTVLLQESPQHGGGLSALGGGGGGESFFNQNKGRTKDAVLSRITKVLLAVFFIATLVVFGLTVWL